MNLIEVSFWFLETVIEVDAASFELRFVFDSAMDFRSQTPGA